MRYTTGPVYDALIAQAEANAEVDEWPRPVQVTEAETEPESVRDDEDREQS